MATLKIDEIVFTRGEGGVLIPQETTLDTFENKPTIKVVPLTRGKLQEIHTMATSKDPTEKIKADNELIKIGLIEPKLTDDQIRDLKPKFASAIAMAIMSASLGISQKEVKEKADELIKDQEDELKKK